LGWALACVALASLPYLVVWVATWGTGVYFVGLLHNVDDPYVYMAWMRQAAHGALLFDDRFTTAPQRAIFFNALFLVLGWVCRLTGLSPLAVFHLARVGFGILFLISVHRLIVAVVSQPAAQRAAFLLVCFSSGVGWLFPRRVPSSPVDLWQTEAISFLSLYQNPLFLAALCLMLWFVLFMLRAQRTGMARYAVAAGALACLLANVHGYDVVTLAVVWPCYLLLRTATEQPRWKLGWVHAAIAGALCTPALAYEYYLLRANHIFHQRVLVPTGSAALRYELLGYGLALPLAGVAVARMLKQRKGDGASADEWLLVVWAVVGLAVPYIPVSFQRKLLMGVHVPIATLAGMGAVRLWGGRRHPHLALAALVAVTFLTNARWFWRAAQNVQENRTESGQRVLLLPTEMDAMRWLEQHCHGEGVLALPLGGVAVFLPALTGCHTYAGHWGETPHFAAKLRATLRFYAGANTGAWQREFLRRARVQYVMYGPAERAVVRRPVLAVPFLTPAYTTGAGEQAVVIYRVAPAGAKDGR
jgi:hypothetical protein